MTVVEAPTVGELDVRIAELEAQHEALMADGTRAEQAWREDLADGGDGTDLLAMCKTLAGRVNDVDATLGELRRLRADLVERGAAARAEAAAEREAGRLAAAVAALPGLDEALVDAIAAAAAQFNHTAVLDLAPVLAARDALDAGYVAAGRRQDALGERLLQRSANHWEVWRALWDVPDAERRYGLGVALVKLAYDPTTPHPGVVAARRKAEIDESFRQAQVRASAALAEARAEAEKNPPTGRPMQLPRIPLG